jgi:hypothetical protein
LIAKKNSDIVCISNSPNNEEAMTFDLFHSARQMPAQLRGEARRQYGDGYKTSLTYRAADVIEGLMRTGAVSKVADLEARNRTQQVWIVVLAGFAVLTLIGGAL